MYIKYQFLLGGAIFEEIFQIRNGFSVFAGTKIAFVHQRSV
jgi:hypothetical protein